MLLVNAVPDVLLSTLVVAPSGMSAGGSFSSPKSPKFNELRARFAMLHLTDTRDSGLVGGMLNGVLVKSENILDK